MIRNDARELGALGIRQQRLLAALLTDADLGTACKTAGISRATGTRALRDSAFVAALRAAEMERMQAATWILLSLGGKAARVLGEAMDDAEAPMATRIRAADVALTKLLALRAAVDIEERLHALEAAVEQGRMEELR